MSVFNAIIVDISGASVGWSVTLVLPGEIIDVLDVYYQVNKADGYG